MKLRTSIPKADMSFILSLMDELEADKSGLGDLDDAGVQLENFGQDLFMRADDADRAGNSDLRTGKAFLVAAQVLECCKQFGELPADLSEKIKYAKVRRSSPAAVMVTHTVALSLSTAPRARRGVRLLALAFYTETAWSSRTGWSDPGTGVAPAHAQRTLSTGSVPLCVGLPTVRCPAGAFRRDCKGDQGGPAPRPPPRHRAAASAPRRRRSSRRGRANSQREQRGPALVPCAARAAGRARL